MAGQSGLSVEGAWTLLSAVGTGEVLCCADSWCSALYRECFTVVIRKECKDSEVFVKMLDNQQKKEGCTCWCKNTDENYSGDRVHVIC